MNQNRTERHQARRRAFQPSVDGRLEDRTLLSTVKAQAVHTEIVARTAAGGQAVEIQDTDGEVYYIGLSGGGNIKATPAPGGRVNLIVKGSKIDSSLTINPVVILPQKNSAHTFRGQLGNGDGRLHINSITVSSGTIGSILGYRTADLSGPVILSSTNRVDRIAFSAINPGASIVTGGDVNTLEVLTNLTIDGAGTGIRIGRDVNFLHTGGNLTVSNTANLIVGRDVGLQSQLAKGTGIAGQGALIEGNLTIGVGSTLVITRNLAGVFLVDGQTSGTSRIFINGTGAGNFISLGGFTP